MADFRPPGPCSTITPQHYILDEGMLVSYRGVATGGRGGYIGIYTSKISLPYKFLCGYWLFFLFDPGQIVVDFEIGITS